MPSEIHFAIRLWHLLFGIVLPGKLSPSTGLRPFRYLVYNCVGGCDDKFPTVGGVSSIYLFLSPPPAPATPPPLETRHPGRRPSVVRLTSSIFEDLSRWQPRPRERMTGTLLAYAGGLNEIRKENAITGE